MRVDSFLGSTIVEAVSQPTGFSPGVAARVLTADGQRVFIKAVSAAQNPDTPDMHRREARIAARLPEVAGAPRLLWSHDESAGSAQSARSDGWVVLLFEDIDGRHPAQPWLPDELDRVLAELFRLGEVLTPSPLSVEDVGNVSDSFRRSLQCWQSLSDSPEELRLELARLDPWSARNLPKLTDLEAKAPDAVAGDTLLHMDVRADNLLLTANSVRVLDWPHVHVGAPWVDLVLFAPSVRMQGGPPPEELFALHPAYSEADRDAVTAVVASIAGYFTYQSLLSPPSGLPTVRTFQAAQGVEARQWLRQRTGWA